MSAVVHDVRRGAIASAAVGLVLLARAHVTVAPGCVVPVPALVLGAGLVLCAAAAWLAVRLSRGFRPSPAWTAARGGGGGPRTEGTGLDDGQRTALAQALGDALSWRAPDTCRDCARGALCEDHAEDVRRRDAYWRLARDLGIEVEL